MSPGFSPIGHLYFAEIRTFLLCLDTGTDTLPFVLVGVMMTLLILLPIAKRMGARSEAAAAATDTSGVTIS
jgi:preprotein translocase subunit YajC